MASGAHGGGRAWNEPFRLDGEGRGGRPFGFGGRRRRARYFFIQGFDAPAATPAACSRGALPAPGGFGLAWIAACFMRRARSIGVSAAALLGRSFIPVN